MNFNITFKFSIPKKKYLFNKFLIEKFIFLFEKIVLRHLKIIK